MEKSLKKSVEDNNVSQASKDPSLISVDGPPPVVDP